MTAYTSFTFCQKSDFINIWAFEEWSEIDEKGINLGCWEWEIRDLIEKTFWKISWGQEVHIDTSKTRKLFSGRQRGKYRSRDRISLPKKELHINCQAYIQRLGPAGNKGRMLTGSTVYGKATSAITFSAFWYMRSTWQPRIYTQILNWNLFSNRIN